MKLALTDAPAGLRVKASMGPNAGKPRVLDAAAYCAELDRPARRFRAMTGQLSLIHISEPTRPY